jgi:hypothetical protein
VARVCALSKDRHETIRLLACATLANVARFPGATTDTDSPADLAALALPVTIKLVGFGNVRFAFIFPRFLLLNSGHVGGHLNS